MITLALWLGFLLLTACYVIPVFGEPSWLALGASALVALGAPLGLALWMVRPLAGFRRAAWFTGSFAAIPLLAVLGLSIAAPKMTARHLRKHAKPAAVRLFGRTTRSWLTQKTTDLAMTWADLLHAPRARLRRSPRKRRERNPAKRPVVRKDLFYAGLRRPRPTPAPPTNPRGRATGRATRVRFVRRGGAIHLEAKGRARRAAALGMLLDTGASLSTLSRSAAKSLGIELPRAPVETELDTAGGRLSFPLVILPHLSVGRASLAHVTVAICDPCTVPGLHGLLGLNFTEHFLLSIDPRRRRLTLRRLPGPENRIHDIEPFLALSGVHGEEVDGRFVLEGQVRNRSPLRVRKLRLEALLMSSKGRILRRHATVIPRLAPQKTRSFSIQGEGHPDAVRYRIELISGRW